MFRALSEIFRPKTVYGDKSTNAEARRLSCQAASVAPPRYITHSSAKHSSCDSHVQHTLFLIHWQTGVYNSLLARMKHLTDRAKPRSNAQLQKLSRTSRTQPRSLGNKHKLTLSCWAHIMGAEVAISEGNLRCWSASTYTYK